MIGRGYVAPNISITGEFTFFKLPEIDEKYSGSYFDLDIYGTVNFIENVGVQVAGGRSTSSTRSTTTTAICRCAGSTSAVS